MGPANKASLARWHDFKSPNFFALTSLLRNPVYCAPAYKAIFTRRHENICIFRFFPRLEGMKGGGGEEKEEEGNCRHCKKKKKTMKKKNIFGCEEERRKDRKKRRKKERKKER